MNIKSPEMFLDRLMKHEDKYFKLFQTVYKEIDQNCERGELYDGHDDRSGFSDKDNFH